MVETSFKIYVPEIILNKDLWAAATEELIDLQIKKQKLQWIGLTLRKDQNAMEKQALCCNALRQWKRGRREDEQLRPKTENEGKTGDK